MPLITSTITPVSSVGASGGSVPGAAVASPPAAAIVSNLQLSPTEQANLLYHSPASATNPDATINPASGGGAGPGAGASSGGHFTQSSIAPLARLSQLLSLMGGDPSGAAPNWKVLSFAVQHQQQHQWCWAAVTASLAMYYNPSSIWTQALLANDQFGQSTCTINGSSSDCDRPWFLDVALQRVGNWISTNPSFVSIFELRSEIDSGRPLAVRVGWATGGGHFLTLTGYSDTNWVNVQDPWFGPSTLDFDVFRTAYQGSGTWTHSFFTKG